MRRHIHRISAWGFTVGWWFFAVPLSLGRVVGGEIASNLEQMPMGST